MAARKPKPITFALKSTLQKDLREAMRTKKVKLSARVSGGKLVVDGFYKGAKFFPLNRSPFPVEGEGN